MRPQNGGILCLEDICWSKLVPVGILVSEQSQQGKRNGRHNVGNQKQMITCVGFGGKDQVVMDRFCSLPSIEPTASVVYRLTGH